jgi:HNH endonuclease
MINEKSEITEELISRVESVLENYAGTRKTITHRQLRVEIKEEINGELWQDILDPIYRRSWERDRFDLTLIVVSANTGRPPFFSQGKAARSVRFDPKKHDEEWVKQLDLIFSTWEKRKASANDQESALSTIPDIEADVEQIRSREDLTENEREILIQARRGQGPYRQQVMKLGNGRCAVTGCSVEPVLEACHLKPWKISTRDEQLDPDNGLCLVANLHRLYDRGLITFDDEGLVRVSKRLSQEDRMSLRLEGRAQIRIPLTAKQKAFLKLHRETRFLQGV